MSSPEGRPPATRRLSRGAHDRACASREKVRAAGRPGVGYPRRVHLFVVSMTLRNAVGDLLIVRKRGTHTFMLPGGKVEPGETHLEAVVREVAEEVAITLDPDAVGLLGTWSAAAANEPGLMICSDVFLATWQGEPVASGEIEEISWLPVADPDRWEGGPLAPLLTEHVLPTLSAR